MTNEKKTDALSELTKLVFNQNTRQGWSTLIALVCMVFVVVFLFAFLSVKP